MTRGLWYLFGGAAVVLIWAVSQNQGTPGPSVPAPANTNAASNGLPTGNLNNQSGDYSTGVNTGDQP